jgi:hypothetical protein
MRIVEAFKAFMAVWRNPQPPVPLQLDSGDPSHLRLLALLQSSGRLIDFLKEDISSFSDAQVGAAVRQIHRECGKSLEEMVTIRPIMDEAEGTAIKVVAGYDPAQVKVVGKLAGGPPYSGVLVHKGWKAHKRSLPKVSALHCADVLAPAEVEVR